MYWYTLDLYMQHVLHTFLPWEREPSSSALHQVFFYLLPVLLIWLCSQHHSNSSGLLRRVAPSSHVHLVAANIFTLTLWSWHFHSVSLLPLFCYTCICLFCFLIALAKRTKASTQHCDWTNFSTSPLSWTPLWSVNIPSVTGQKMYLCWFLPVSYFPGM